MIAIIEAYKNGLLKSHNLMRNILSGIIVGVVALPLAMAFAIASGAAPEQGLYTAIVAALVVGLFGGSRIQIAGPTGAFVVILASITAHYGLVGLQMASLMAGIILVMMGLLKLGNVIKFIPDPVIVGFTSGIGVIIFVGEWKDFFGLPLTQALDAPFYQKFWELLQALPHLDWPTTLLSLFTLAIMLITPKFLKRIPAPLIALLIASTVQWLFKFSSIATLGSTFGGISSHFPGFHFPTTDFSTCMNLVGAAFTIALLGAIESLLSATAADAMAGMRHHSNQELIGQGIANIVAPLFGGFAATGAIARTATNVRNGGNSPVSAITHSVLLILIIAFLAPLAASIPLCCLAAILFVVAYNMSDIPHFIYLIKHAPRYDVIVMITTFLLTIFTNLVLAVNIGVVLAMLFFVGRMSTTSSITIYSKEALQEALSSKVPYDETKDILVYTIQGPLFFGVAEKIERVLSATKTLPQSIIFRLHDVPFMDITGLEMFSEIIQNYHRQGVHVYLCEANKRVEKKIKAIGLLAWTVNTYVTLSLSECYQSACQ